MSNFLEVNITIVHEDDILVSAVGLSLAALSRAAFETNERAARRLRDSRFYNIPGLVDHVDIFLKENRNNLVWLHAVSQGSTKLSAKVIYVVGGIILGGLGGFAGDVAEESEVYQDAVEWTAEQADETLHDLGEAFENILEETFGGSDTQTQCQIVDRRLEVTITPGRIFSVPPYKKD